MPTLWDSLKKRLLESGVSEEELNLYKRRHGFKTRPRGCNNKRIKPKVTQKKDEYVDLVESPLSIQPHKRIKRWTFEPGAIYEIDDHRLRFLRKEGIHHIFQSAVRGVKWLTSYTDSQLVDKNDRKER